MANLPTLPDEPGASHGPGPLARGLEAGYNYARYHREHRTQLKGLARARSASDVRASLAGADVAGAVQEHDQFWSGFAHGVAKFLVEDARVLE